MSYVQPNLEYCSSIWSLAKTLNIIISWSAYKINSLQSILRSAVVIIVYNIPHRENNSDIRIRCSCKSKLYVRCEQA